MSNYSKIYWLTRLDSIGNLFEALIWAGGAIMSIYAFMSFFYYMEEDEPLPSKYTRWRNYAIGFIVVGAIFNAAIPNKNEAILIMAGGKTLDYVQKDTSLSKVPYQTTAIISEYLDKTLKEMKSDKK